MYVGVCVCTMKMTFCFENCSAYTNTHTHTLMINFYFTELSLVMILQFSQVRKFKQTFSLFKNISDKVILILSYSRFWLLWPFEIKSINIFIKFLFQKLTWWRWKRGLHNFNLFLNTHLQTFYTQKKGQKDIFFSSYLYIKILLEIFVFYTE